MRDNQRLLTLATAPDARLDDLLALAQTLYPVHFEPVSLGEVAVDILQISDLSSHIDQLMARSSGQKKISLPFWAKIWPASFPMSLLLTRIDPASAPRLLEIGAGVGLCGLVAARRGFAVAITDIEPEALLFIRVSILKNGLEATARAVHLDFMTGSLEERFDAIVASEALYIPDSHEPLTKCLTTHLAPGGQVLMASDIARPAPKFFAHASQHFAIQRMEAQYRGEDDQPKTSILFRMRAHTNA